MRRILEIAKETGYVIGVVFLMFVYASLFAGLMGIIWLFLFLCTLLLILKQKSEDLEIILLILIITAVIATVLYLFYIKLIGGV